MRSFVVLLLALYCLTLVSVVSAACPTCANDETCNTISSQCVCIPSMYTESVKPPTPLIQCGNDMSLWMPKCQLEKNRYDSGSLHLNDATDTACVPVQSPVNDTAQLIFHSPLISGKCGNNVEINGTHVIYSNTLYISPKISTTVSRSNVTMNFSCSYPLNMNIVLNVTLKPVIGTTQIPVPESNGVVSASMMLFKESSYTQSVTTDTVLQVEDTVYVSVKMATLDTFSIKVNNLYVSGSPDSSSDPKYYVLKNGCPDLTLEANLVKPVQNGYGIEARFEMKVFQVSGLSSLYLFADVTICNNTCTPVCTSRSGDLRAQESSATVSVYLEAEDKMNLNSGALDYFPMPWTLSASLLSLLFMKLM